ncbi:MAG: 30S ribosomal protein S17 [Candidatus Omnitrophota bacterium]
MQNSKRVSIKKVVIGTVVSDKMDKTIVIKVGRLTIHPVFKKRIKKFNKIKAHDAKNVAKVGDVVKVVQSRPISRDKRWRLLEVVEKSV